MSTQQAYINGFVKRAAQYGYNYIEAMNILKAAELKGDQHKLDVDKDGKIEADDLKKLRQRKEAAELKGDQHKLDVDKDGKIEASDLKKLRQRKEAGLIGDAVQGVKQLASNAGDTYNNYIAAKNTPSAEDMAANLRARSAYAQQMAPQPAYQKLPGALTGGTLAGGTGASVPAPAPMSQVRSVPGGIPAVRPRP